MIKRTRSPLWLFHSTSRKSRSRSPKLIVRTTSPPISAKKIALNSIQGRLTPHFWKRRSSTRWLSAKKTWTTMVKKSRTSISPNLMLSRMSVPHRPSRATASSSTKQSSQTASSSKKTSHSTIKRVGKKISSNLRWETLSAKWTKSRRCLLLLKTSSPMASTNGSKTIRTTFQDHLTSIPIYLKSLN